MRHGLAHVVHHDPCQTSPLHAMFMLRIACCIYTYSHDCLSQGLIGRVLGRRSSPISTHTVQFCGLRAALCAGTNLFEVQLYLKYDKPRTYGRVGTQLIPRTLQPRRTSPRHVPQQWQRHSGQCVHHAQASSRAQLHTPHAHIILIHIISHH